MGTCLGGTHLPWGPVAIPQHSKALLWAGQHWDLGEAAITQGAKVALLGMGLRTWAPCTLLTHPGGSLPCVPPSTGLEQSTTANGAQTHPESLTGPPLQPEEVIRFALSLQR